MADLPFGFSAGDDPDPDKPKKDREPGPGDPFGFGAGGFNPADLGQIFTQLGQMFSGAGSAMSGGSSGPVNYDLARKLASSSIGFVAPIPAGTTQAVGDALHLADTWLDAVTALPAGSTSAVAWTPSDWIDHTLGTWKRLCDPVAEQISSVWTQAMPEEAKAMAGPLIAMMTQMGGMAFGSQLGQALGRLGSTVTIVEVMPTLLPGAEPELVTVLADQLASEGVEILLGSTIDRVAPAGAGVRMTITRDGQTSELEADAVLVATGRTPDVEGLNLEAAGVDGDRRGIQVDPRLATTADGVFAAGDVLGRPFGAFTHVARRLGLEVTDNIFGWDVHDVDPDVGPTAIFTDPEIAAIGLTERAARDAGHDVVVGTGAFRGGKARAWGEERGLVKVILSTDGRILGAHIAAYHAADLLHPIVVAMQSGDQARQVMRASQHIHPTLGEVVKSAIDTAT